MNLGQRLAVGAIILIVIDFGFATAMSAFLVGKQNREEGEEKLDAALEFIDSDIEGRFRRITERLNSVATKDSVITFLNFVKDFESFYDKNGNLPDPSLMTLLSDPTKDIGKELADLVTNNQEVGQLAVLGAAGTITAAAVTTSTDVTVYAGSGLSRDTRQYLVNSARKGGFFPVRWQLGAAPDVRLKGRVTAVPAIDFVNIDNHFYVVGSVPVYDKERHFIGVVSGADRIDQAYVTQISRMIKVDVNEFIGAEFAAGTLVDFRYNQEWMTAHRDRHRKTVAGKTENRFERFLFDVSTGSEDYYQGFLALYDANGDYFGGFSTLLSKAKTSRKTREIMLSLLLIAALGIIFACVFTWAGTKRILTTPLSALLKSVQRITEGNLDTPLEVHSGGELGELGRNIEIMRVRIKTFTENLQNLVAERTSELATALELVTLDKRRIQEISTELSGSYDELKKAQGQLMESAHQAGMAEIATGVLHNVGNILNSVNTSNGEIHRILRTSRLSGLFSAGKLLEQHKDHLAEFVATDAKGRQLPKFFLALAKQVEAEYAQMLTEVDRLASGVGLITEVIRAQQSYAKTDTFLSARSLQGMVDDALKLQESTLASQGIAVRRSYRAAGEVVIARNKFMNVLVNLLTNAADAMEATAPEQRILTVEIEETREHLVVVIKDNGVGIAEEHLRQIFQHGFTTKPKGHGFGLHSCANLMTEIGGKLEIRSAGVGRGAECYVLIPRAKVEGGGTAEAKRPSYPQAS